MLDVWPYLGLGCALIVICFVAGLRRLAALDETQFAIDGSCVQVTSQGQTQKYCAADAVTQVEQAIAKTLTADQRTAFEHLFSGLANVGIDTTQSGGKWYVNPVRSFFDLSNALVSGLQGNDLLTLLALIPQ